MIDMPNSPELESAYLGCILLDSDAFSLEGASESLFHSSQNAEVFRAMRGVLAESRVLDTALLLSYLNRDGGMQKAGGVQRVLELTAKSTGASMAQAYLAQLRELARRRALIEIANDVQGRAFGGDSESTDIIGRVRNALSSLDASESVVQPGDIAKEADSAIRDILEGRVKPIKTGIRKLDAGIIGLREGIMSVIAGRPAMGKTTTAMQVALNVATGSVGPRPEPPIPVLWFGIEMTRAQLAMKCVESLGGVHLFGDQHSLQGAVRSGKVVDGMGKLSRSLMHLETSAKYLDEIIHRARGWVRSVRHKFGSECNPLIMLDYIQRVKLRHPTGVTAEDVGKVSWALKSDIAEELGVHVCVLSQLNRGLESRTDKRPNMGDLKASGDIEQDAALIMMLYRPYEYSKEESEKEDLEIEVVKSRFGGTGRVKATFKGAISRVE